VRDRHANAPDWRQPRDLPRICRNGTTATTKDSYQGHSQAPTGLGRVAGRMPKGRTLRSKSLIAPTGCSRDCSGSEGNIALFSHGQVRLRVGCAMDRTAGLCGTALRDISGALRHIRTRKRLSGKTGHIALERRDYILERAGAAIDRRAAECSASSPEHVARSLWTQTARLFAAER